MCDPVTLTVMTVAATAVTAYGQIQQGMAANAQAKYEAKVATENRKHELNARNDAWRRENSEQMRHWRKITQRLGEQRADMAAAGLDVNFGTPADIQEETLQIGMEDSFTISENFRKEVQGYEINAANYTMQGRAAKSRGKAAMTAGLIGAAGTILGGASQVGKMNMKPAPSGGANFGGP